MSLDLTGLPLFDWRPTATVLAFPAARQAKRVHYTAAGLLARRGEAKSTFFGAALTLLENELAAANLDEAAIWSEVSAFNHAVHAECARLAGWDDPLRDRR